MQAESAWSSRWGVAKIPGGVRQIGSLENDPSFVLPGFVKVVFVIGGHKPLPSAKLNAPGKFAAPSRCVSSVTSG
jgi:hypothetical protein